MNSSNIFFKGLNETQKKAVIETEGPCLVAAGAGSGKTRVLTTRLAHIINEKKAWPNQILCVTFTNKAAKEMQNRVLKLISGKSTSVPWLGTFHSTSVKFLRRHAEALGLKSNFTILDTDDQKKLLRKICKAENIDAKKISPSFIITIIDKWKNKGLLPEDIKLKKSDELEKLVLGVYKIYQNKIRDLNACDFGDLILYCVKLFENNDDIREIYKKNFKYILVDEYQDTNFIQNKWLSLLVNDNRNICCVGDDDQSIYSWRGAEIKNFLGFDKIYDNCKIFKLEQNYRSTNKILSVANSLISNNKERLGKNLWTESTEGSPVYIYEAYNGDDESNFIVEKIQEHLSSGGKRSDVALLYRSNFLSRRLEEELNSRSIPYKIFGGFRFFERAEVKDVIAYLRLSVNTSDDSAFERTVNNPPRGLGEKTIQLIRNYSKENSISMWETINQIEKTEITGTRAINALNSFISISI